MRKQKKDRTPAKGNGLIIGNRRTGNINLLKRLSVHNSERRILTEQEQVLHCGSVPYIKLFRALELKFEGIYYE